MKILSFSFIPDKVYELFKKCFINTYLRAACRRSHFVEQYARLYVRLVLETAFLVN